MTRAAVLAVLLTTVLATGTTGAASALRSTLTATASSTTDLIDNQIVQLTGSGFDPKAGPQWGTSAEVCPSAPAPQFPPCNALTLGILHVDADGSLSGSVALRAVGLDGTDCRTHACELRVGSPNDPLRSVRIPLSFLPTAPLNPPRVTATPSTQLADGQTVRLSGEHYPPLVGVKGWQCITETGKTGACADASGLPPMDVKDTSSATGTFEAEVTVHRVYYPYGVPKDCGPGGGSCVLAGVWYFPGGSWAGDAFTYAYGVTPISFATTPSSTTTPSPPRGTGGTSSPAPSVSATPTFTG